MFRRLSLTSRLTIFFIALASSVILGLALLFMVEADRHFVDLDSAALDDKKAPDRGHSGQFSIP